MTSYHEQYHQDLRVLRDELRATLRARYASQLNESQLAALDQASGFVDRANIILSRRQPTELELHDAKDLLRIAQECF